MKGVIDGIKILPRELMPKQQWCSPNNATLGQSVRIVRSYMQKKPEVLHMPFAALIIVAMREAFPCGK